VLAGREALLEDFHVVLERAERFAEGDRSWVLTGLRGVGKTALLDDMLARAAGRTWITVRVEAVTGEPFARSLAQALVVGLRTATGLHPAPRLRRLLAAFGSFSLTVEPTGSVALGFDIEPLAGTADTGVLARDLVDLFAVLGTTARELGVGALVVVDELHEVGLAELHALNAAVHELGQGSYPLPVLVVGAGLPSLPAVLAEATSYAERLWDFRRLDAVPEAAARAALDVPVLELGVAWATGALAAAAEASRGYPYLVQAVGKHVWDHAATSPIERVDVDLGLVAARREVDDGLYRSRWERATPAQRTLLRALAVAGDEAAIADVAAALGRTTQALSVARAELIRKGLLYAPTRGRLAFTVPGMGDFVLREPD